jgi:hypothetical protein
VSDKSHSIRISTYLIRGVITSALIFIFVCGILFLIYEVRRDIPYENLTEPEQFLRIIGFDIVPMAPTSKFIETVFSSIATETELHRSVLDPSDLEAVTKYRDIFAKESERVLIDETWGIYELGYCFSNGSYVYVTTSSVHNPPKPIAVSIYTPARSELNNAKIYRDSKNRKTQLLWHLRRRYS